MAPIGKLYGVSGNSRFRRALAVATYAGLDVETDPKFTMADNAWKTPEFLKKFPFGYLPAYEGADGLLLQESGAISDYCEWGFLSTLAVMMRFYYSVIPVLITACR